MAEWHLRELEEQLARRGWRVAAIHEGPAHGFSASWEIERDGRCLLLDFEGLDDLVTLPVEQAYAVEVRGHATHDLYFGKKSTSARPNRSWQRDLLAFVAALESLSEQAKP
jgi:hypothetical protein